MRILGLEFDKVTIDHIVFEDKRDKQTSKEKQGSINYLKDYD